MWIPSYPYAYVRMMLVDSENSRRARHGRCGEKVEVEKYGSGEVWGGQLDILGKVRVPTFTSTRGRFCTTSVQRHPYQNR